MAEGQVLFVRSKKSNNESEGREDEDSSAANDVWDDTALVQAYDRAVSMAKERVEQRMRLDKGSASENESNESLLKQDGPNVAKGEVVPGGSNTLKKSGKKKKKNQSHKEWQVGVPCQTVYSGDGVIYEAIIISLQQSKGTCVVRYIGYDNEEEVSIKELLPSQGPAARKKQKKEAIQQELEERLVSNGMDVDCSGGESPKEMNYKPKTGSIPKSPQSSKMDWESRTVRPPGSNFFQSQFRSLHMPSLGIPPMAVPPPPPPHLTSSFPEEDAEALSSMLMSWYMSGFHTGYFQGLKHARNISSRGGNMSRGSSSKK